jgi:hypothetical protein
VELREQGLSYAKMLLVLREKFPLERWGTSRNLTHRYVKAREVLQAGGAGDEAEVE